MLLGSNPLWVNCFLICYDKSVKKTLTFITGNPTKAKQLSMHLTANVKHKAVNLEEVQSLDLEKVVQHKVRGAYSAVQEPVLVEDFAMTFNALGKLPGPFIKWFFDEIGPEGLCKWLDAHNDRSAKAMVLFGYYDGKNIKTYSGEIEGTIADSPRKGGTGFPSETIFIPKGYNKTWSEMNAEEQTATSIRRIALKKLEADLQN